MATLLKVEDPKQIAEYRGIDSPFVSLGLRKQGVSTARFGLRTTSLKGSGLVGGRSLLAQCLFYLECPAFQVGD